MPAGDHKYVEAPEAVVVTVDAEQLTPDADVSVTVGVVVTVTGTVVTALAQVEKVPITE